MSNPGKSPVSVLLRKASGLLAFILPPRRWRVPLIVVAGAFCGLGLLVAKLSNATSYLSDDPKACINCHIMAPQYASWQRGSHGRVATCNDCHVPHENVFRKYAFKAMDGTRHSYMFTFHLEPQVIRVHEPGIKVIQSNCVRCHEAQLARTDLVTMTGSKALHGEGMLCWHCHRETPHGRVNSLASVPHARVPVISPAVPAWISTLLEKEKQEARRAQTPSKEKTP